MIYLSYLFEEDKKIKTFADLMGNYICTDQ